MDPGKSGEGNKYSELKRLKNGGIIHPHPPPCRGVGVKRGGRGYILPSRATVFLVSRKRSYEWGEEGPKKNPNYVFPWS